MTYLKPSSPAYFSFVSGFVSFKKSLSISRATDFCTSLQKGEWKITASALSRLNCVGLPTSTRHTWQHEHCLDWTVSGCPHLQDTRDNMNTVWTELCRAAHIYKAHVTTWTLSRLNCVGLPTSTMQVATSALPQLNCIRLSSYMCVCPRCVFVHVVCARCLCVCVCVCARACVHVCVYEYVFMSVCAWCVMYVFEYVCVYVCVCMCLCVGNLFSESHTSYK